MATAILPAGYDGTPGGEAIEIELRRPWLAALLAWLIPGLGHMYQGRTGKGLLFFVCVLGTFVSGMWIGSGKVVYASTPGQEPWRWQYFCQLGVGLPALPALVQRQQRIDQKPDLWGGFMAPPKNSPQKSKDDSGNVSTQPNELAKWTVETHPRYEIGTVYTVVAGLLNVLVICDAFAGPLVLAPREKPGEKSAEDAADDAAKPGGG